MFSSHHHLHDSLNKQLYPDLVNSGGLGLAFTELMAEVNPDIYITKPYRDAYANASGSNGAVHLTVHPTQRMFVCEIRRGGLSIGRIVVRDLLKSAEIFDRWLSSELTSGDISKAFPNIIIRPDIALFEGPDRDQVIWNVSLYLGGDYRDLLYLVHSDPVLKGAIPQYSMRLLYFVDGPFQNVEMPVISEKYGVYFFHNKKSDKKSNPMNAYEAYLHIKNAVVIT